MTSFLRFLFPASLAILLCAFQDKPPQAGEQKPGQQPDATTIAKLVKQLGSRDLKERQKATEALTQIGFPALPALREAAKSKDAEIASRAGRLVEIIENSLDQLLEDYLGYGLPLPPKDAKMVKYVSGGGGIVNDEITPLSYFLGFLLKPGTKDEPPVLLVGTQQPRLYRESTFEIVEPKPELVKQIEPLVWGHVTFETNAGLAIALQCKARGWNDLARELWTQSIKQQCGHIYGAFNQPANLPYRTAVSYLAWAHYANELAKPDTDRAKIARQIKRILAAEPRLNTPENQKLLKCLEAALVPSSSKPGSVERMIDDLTETCSNSSLSGRGEKPDEPYTKLAHLGFAAVPDLIEHLDDDRLTRSASPGFNNFPPCHAHVKDFVSGLLRELAGEEVARNWLERLGRSAVDKATAKEWWKKAQRVGEEAYFLANVLPKSERREWPNSLMLEIITKKYPQNVPKLYKTILDERPKMVSWPVADAVAKSSLPKEKKLELFLYASHRKTPEHRQVGLVRLQKLDPQQFLKILLNDLEALPKTPKESYWMCPEATCGRLVMLTDDPAAWKMLEKVAKRSDVGLRMEFMNPMNYTSIGNRQRQQRLDFLAVFLDDAEAPDYEANPAMFDGPHAGFMFKRLEVRNLAAMKIASILKMPDRPDRTWTPQQWEVLRKKVKEALKR